MHISSNCEYRRPFGAAPAGGTVSLSLDVWDDSGATAEIRTWIDGRGEALYPMEGVWQDGHLRFTGTFAVPDPAIVWYYFKIHGSDGRTSYYGTKGGATSGEGALYEYEPSSWQISVYLTRKVLPEWYKQGIIYQIFPDRFARGKDWRERVAASLSQKRNGPARRLVEDWYQPPCYQKDASGRIEAWDFYGGTLSGIEEKLGYLEALGVTVLYINPIFESASNHRYDTGDYMKVDPMLGDEQTFAELCRKAAEHGMSVMLDGVFNHTGCDSRYFNKYGNYPELGAYQSPESPYRSWYKFADDGSYASWWGVDDLPDVRSDNPEYHDYICGKDGVIRHWMRLGARGWRLDVADELPEPFIRDIAGAAQAEKPDAAVIGEVWEDASNKIAYGKPRHYLLGGELDSAMNYPFRGAVLDFLLNKADAYLTAARFEQLLENYPHEALYSALNLLGSHDRSRIFTLLGGAPDPDTMDDAQRAAFRLDEGQRGLAKSRLWDAVLLQMTMPGVPSVYYGDEAGMEGYTDPYNRGPFPWGREDKDCFNICRNAIAIRKSLPLLVDGDFHPFAVNADVFGFTRSDGTDTVMVLINASLRTRHEFTVPMAGEAVDDILSGQDVEVADGQAAVGLWPLGSAVLYFHKAQMLERPLEHGMGVLCHITSLPNAGAPGTMGEPARKFIDYLAAAHQRYWQILPVNPCDGHGSPYAGLSAFAGNTRLVEGTEEDLAEKAAAVADGDPAYRAFCEKEKEWLVPYATFRAIKKIQGETAWQTWPQKYRTFRPALAREKRLAPLVKAHMKRQYVFSAEWRELKDYAHSKGIALIGDMPMYVSADSSDVWSSQSLFMLDEEGVPSSIAGCPPDQFSEDGQVWGNPTYRWKEMEKDGYSWWMRRFARACELYDYVRLDHFLGFSSYFSIPAGKLAKDGAWRFGPGAELFRRVFESQGPLPFIAEDLGSITPAVHALSARCGFPGLDVVQFADTDVRCGYKPLAGKIACSGTHDTQTLLGWVRQRFGEEGAEELAAKILDEVLASDAEVAIVPLQDVLGLGDEARMNVPGKAEGNWSWQAEASALGESEKHLAELAERSGRA